VHTDAQRTPVGHRDSVVVAIGIYVGNATPDAALVWDGDFIAISATAHADNPETIALRIIVEAGTARSGRPVDRIAISYPGWWDPLRVDRLLRGVRATDVIVDRYLTSGDAVVTWWTQMHGSDDTRRAGPFLVHEIGGESAGLTVVHCDGTRLETVASCEAAAEDPSELAGVARRVTHSARLSMTEVVGVLVVGTDEATSPVVDALSADLGRPVWCCPEGGHAVALGTALVATF
jgi:hypothetical protein